MTRWLKRKVAMTSGLQAASDLHAVRHSRPTERRSCRATSILCAAEKDDVRKYVSGHKTLHHPSKGVMTFEHSSFQAPDELSLGLALRRRSAASRP